MVSNQISDFEEGVPLLGRKQGAFRLELCHPTSEGLEKLDDPFLNLTQSSQLSRILLGQIRLGEDKSLQYLAIKIQKNSYPPEGSGVIQNELNNPQIDENWIREFNHLKILDTPENISLFTFGKGPIQSKPVTFCKKQKKYFHPLCPQCTHFLVDCKDDSLLKDHGLPPYTRSTQRFLYCKNCFESHRGKSRTFYTYSLHDDLQPKKEIKIKRRGELYRDFSQLIHGTLSEEQKTKVASLFPCFECPVKNECYPSDIKNSIPIQAETFLTPLSFYEFSIIPLEALHLHYDEWMDLLGGAPWDSLFAQIQQEDPGRMKILSPLKDQFTHPFQFITQGNAGGTFPVEVLRLKLISFTQACKNLSLFQKSTKGPFLNLNPKKFMVNLPITSPDLPSRWFFKTNLVGLGGPKKYTLYPDLNVPSSDANPLFLSPFIRNSTFGQIKNLKVKIKTLKIKNKDISLEGEVHTPHSLSKDIGLHDTVRIVPSTGTLEGLTLWAKINDVSTKHFGFMASLKIDRIPLSPESRISDFQGSVTFFQNFQVPCDLYSMGMILFQTLLANDQQDIHLISDSIVRVQKKLELAFEGSESPSLNDFSNTLFSLLDKEKNLFNKENILFRASDREGRNLIPDHLWRNVLLLAFRMVSTLSGFGFCSHHAQYLQESPEVLIDRMISELISMGARCHVELFAKKERDQDVTHICTDVMNEIASKGLEVSPTARS